MKPAVRLAAALCLGAAVSAHAAAPRYTLESLAPVDEGWVPVAINSADQIAGNKIYPQYGLVYKAGHVDGLVGGTASTAAGINTTGVVAGHTSAHGGPSRATIWRQYWEPVDLGLLPTGTFSLATGINDDGKVVGIADVDSPDGSRPRAFIWRNGKMKQLANLPGGDISYARAINARGQITGDARNASGSYRAVRWTNGVIEDLGLLSGGTTSTGLAINRRGDVVGQADANGRTSAFIYRTGTTGMDALPPLFGTENEGCIPKAINAAREIVGNCDDWLAEKHGAFLYRGGRVRNLNDVLDASARGWDVYNVTFIDDQGRILAQANDPQGHWHPVLLTPVGN